MKRSILVICACLAVLFTISSCASILDGEKLVVTAHEEPVPTETDSVITAGNYEELKESINEFVRNRQETGLIRIYSYDGNIEEDVKNACNDIKNNDPYGAYAVSELTGTTTQVVSYYMAEIRINYKNVTKEQLDAIITVSTLRYLKSDLQDMIAEYEPSVTILTKALSLTNDEALDYISQIYYENPMDIVMMPITTVAFYPDEGPERIVEFTFGYTYKQSILKVMEKSLRNTVQNIAKSISGSSDAAILLQLGERLMETTKYDTATDDSGEYTTQNLAATAYGALISGSAVSEGYAMAYKALCDELGIECYVVTGQLNGKPHAWNIVALEGNYYHIDIGMCDLNGIATAFLKNDTDMKKTYSWDTSKYKVCNGPLTYAKLTGSSQ